MSEEDDRRSIERFVTGTAGDGSPSRASTIDDVLTAIADCRVVVTGSYHAAVFALSMGVPAVGLAASRYYARQVQRGWQTSSALAARWCN